MSIMKVITDKDWILQSITDRGFLFKSRRFGDELCVKSTKYVLKHINLVLFCCAPERGGVEKKITLSRASQRRLDDISFLSRDLKEQLASGKGLTVNQVHKLSSL